MREVIRHIQAARKEAGLNVDDRIELFLDTDDEELTAAIHEHTSTIQAETLADTLSQEEFDYKKEVKVEDTTLVVSLQKHLA
jgi:isoleucyl-tRNA synthetase